MAAIVVWAAATVVLAGWLGLQHRGHDISLWPRWSWFSGGFAKCWCSAAKDAPPDKSMLGILALPQLSLALLHPASTTMRPCGCLSEQ